jgi:hypothetical protein
MYWSRPIGHDRPHSNPLPSAPTALLGPAVGFTVFDEPRPVNEHVEACRQKAAECEQKALAATKQETARLY